MHPLKAAAGRGAIDFREIFRQGCASFRNPMPDRAVNIKVLSIELPSLEGLKPRAISFHAQMFPNIQKLQVVGTDTDVIPFGQTRDSWRDLEELDVMMWEMEIGIKNFDSAFCGIFLQEVAELREKDEEYLRSLNIVPVMPSMTSLKRLRTFNFEIDDQNLIYQHGSQGEAAFFISKVTALVAFQRCPALANVTLTAYGERFERDLQHLKPYASVVSKDYNV